LTVIAVRAGSFHDDPSWWMEEWRSYKRILGINPLTALTIVKRCLSMIAFDQTQMNFSLAI
jgi:hypothetical protein